MYLKDIKRADLCNRSGSFEKYSGIYEKQWFCLACMFAFIIFYAFTQWHIGFVAIIFSVIMIFAGCVDQKDVIDKTKWGTVVMVAGSGILASVVQSLGGITILSNLIGWIATVPTVAGIYGAVSGVLSMFTHAMSVPIPILLQQQRKQ